MKKVKVEVETTLTYKPFENLSDMIKDVAPNQKTEKEDKNEK